MSRHPTLLVFNSVMSSRLNMRTFMNHLLHNNSHNWKSRIQSGSLYSLCLCYALILHNEILFVIMRYSWKIVKQKMRHQCLGRPKSLRVWGRFRPQSQIYPRTNADSALRIINSTSRRCARPISQRYVPGHDCRGTACRAPTHLCLFICVFSGALVTGVLVRARGQV